jgi:TonB family protein
MIATWMVYSLAVFALFGLAGIVLEAGMRRRGMPLRGVWVGALLASLVVSLTPWLLSRPSAVTVAQSVMEIAPVSIEFGVSGQSIVGAPSEGSSATPRVSLIDASRQILGAFDTIDLPLRYGWALASGLLALVLAASARNLGRQRKSWRATTIDGVPALISARLGPAVVGLFRARIVLPEWVLGLANRQRELILAHEDEHLRAGDTRLLALALLSAVMMPWNPVLWWQIRRLRHAVELDCDARVLRRCPDVRGYSSLLIELGQRRRPGAFAIAAFAESSSLLERRIETILAPKPRSRRLPLAFSAGIAAALTLLVLEIPRPALAQARQPVSAPPTPIEAAQAPTPIAAAKTSTTRPAAPGESSRGGGDAFAGDTLRARVPGEDYVALTDKEYPIALRSAGVEGNATLRFTVDRQGRARDISVLAATQPEFSEAARRVVEQIPFWAARVGDQAVEDLVPAFEVRFNLHRAAQTPRHAPSAGERLLRAAITQYYPDLLRAVPARTPYVYLVVNERGEVVRHALDWQRPSTPMIRDAILNQFPDLPKTRSAISGGSGYSVRTGIAGGKDIEVYWATLKEPAAVAGPIRWGPYPLDAVTASNGFPSDAVREAVRERHASAIQQGIPKGNSLWFIATAGGKVLDSGVASGADIRKRMSEMNDSSAFVLVMFVDAPDSTKVRMLGTVLAPKVGDDGVIAGRVTDESGNPVAGSTVLFRDRHQGTVTNADGQYRFANVPPGNHTLVARRAGGQPETSKQVRVGADGGAEADFVVR